MPRRREKAHEDSGRGRPRGHTASRGAPASHAPTPSTPGGVRAAFAAFAAFAAPALVLVAALILHFPALETPFFADDYLFLDQAERGSLPQVLASPDPIGNFYRPVGRQMYFWLVTRAGGGSPRVFHAVNLALWLAILALVFAVAKRLAGARAGLIAAGFLAVHYAADVPVRWASGSQDLLAIAGALLALRLHLAGRRLWAGFALLAALLSKEIVALTPLVAVVAARRPEESWRDGVRRAWPLAAAVAIWALLAWLATHARAGGPERLALGPAAAIAALVHLVQVAAAVEWGAAGPTGIPPAWPALVPLVLVLLAIMAGGRARAPQGTPREAGAGRGVLTGLVWAIAGTAPIAAVADIWSAYFYIFALCGIALAVGAWLARWNRGWSLVAVTLIAWSSARSIALPEFALVRGPWTARSRINRHYIERGTGAAQRYLSQLLAARPTLPPRSTLFFSGVPGGVAFQTADGPLVRWAYRDSSLRSYYLSSFDSVKARRGPLFFIQIQADSLRDMTSQPTVYYQLALGMIVSEKPGVAREILGRERERNPSSLMTRYWLAWLEWDLGARARSLESLAAAGFRPDPGPTKEIAGAIAALEARDTLGSLVIAERAVRDHALDPDAHALLADLARYRGAYPSTVLLESYVARLLAPGSPQAWRRWALLQVEHNRQLEAARSLRRYFDLAGGEADRDAEAQGVANMLRTRYPTVASALDPPRPAP